MPQDAGTRLRRGFLSGSPPETPTPERIWPTPFQAPANCCLWTEPLREVPVRFNENPGGLGG
jgi:hypothetical protein